EAVTIDTENVFVVRRPLRRVRLQLVRAAASEPEGQESLSPEIHEDHATTKAPAEEPWANACVEIKSGSRTWKTQADEDGWVDLRIPMSARQATLVVAPGCEEARQFQLDFGILDPLTEFRGVLQRLRNLGYPAVERSEWTPELRGVLADFQRDHGLSSSGELD